MAALQVTPVHYLFRPDDEFDAAPLPGADRSHRPAGHHLQRGPLVLSVTGPADPHHAGVPGVIGVKQSAGDLKLVADLIAMARPEDHIFTAVDALLYPSLALKARGAIAAILSAAPRACVELWDAVQQGDHTRALGLHTRLLALWNAMVGDNLPACTKFAQSLQGCPAGHPRAPMPQASAAQQAAIREALRGLQITSAKAA